MALEPARRLPSHTGIGGYALAYAVLLALTVTTFLASRLELGAWNVTLALAIACAKATIVVAVFMHLKDHAGTNRAYFLAGLFFIALLIGLVLTDVATRLPPARPQ